MQSKPRARSITVGVRTILSLDFKEFIESLNSNDVRYLVIGGYAMALHGKPRYTKDLDVLLDCTVENASRVLKALSDFGFASLGLTAEDFTAPNQLIQLGYPPNRIDLLTSADGIDFKSSYMCKMARSIDGIEVSFISIPNLIANKRATGRLQDLADIETLEGNE